MFALDQLKDETHTHTHDVNMDPKDTHTQRINKNVISETTNIRSND